MPRPRPAMPPSREPQTDPPPGPPGGPRKPEEEGAAQRKKALFVTIAKALEKPRLGGG